MKLRLIQVLLFIKIVLLSATGYYLVRYILTGKGSSYAIKKMVEWEDKNGLLDY